MGKKNLKINKNNLENSNKMNSSVLLKDHLQFHIDNYSIIKKYKIGKLLISTNSAFTINKKYESYKQTVYINNDNIKHPPIKKFKY